MSVRVRLFAVAFLLLSGCDRGVSDLELYTEEVKNRPSDEAPPLPGLRNPQLTPRKLGPDPFAPLH
jgi:Tfp pilus assembly protein PilP